MIYNYNLARARLISETGGTLSDRPLIRFATKPTWTIRFCAVSTGTVTALDVSDAVAWRAAVDRDHSTATEPMCRTLNDDIDQSAAATGEISVPLDANTATFLAAVDGKESLAAWFELWGLDGNGDAVYYVKFPISTGMPIDPASGEAPAAPVEQWADKTYLEARLAAGYEIELSDDGLTWYALELDGEGAPIMPDTAGWWHYRHRLAGGVWSDPIPLMRGPTGAKGEPFSFGAVGLLAGRSTYDDEAANFTYLATDTGDVYYKLSATSADWSSAIPFAAADSLALKTDITAHNESGTAHNDIRVELGNKVDKVDGKGLSTNDYSNEDKAKVNALGSMSAEDAADYRTAEAQDLIDAEKADVADIATAGFTGSYSDLINKPYPSFDTPFGLTSLDDDGVYYSKLDDVDDAIELYNSSLNLHSIEMDIVSSNSSFAGNIVLVPYINGVASTEVVVPVTASIATVSIPLTAPKGMITFTRNYESILDTLKDGETVVSARVYKVRRREGSAL